MQIEIVRYTKERIDDVIQYELNLRKEEEFWGWEINDAYIQSVKESFEKVKTNPSETIVFEKHSKKLHKYNKNSLRFLKNATKKDLFKTSL